MRVTHARGFSTLEIVVALSILVLAISATLILVPESAYIDGTLAAEASELAAHTLSYQEALARKDFNLVVGTTTTELINGTTFTTKVGVEPQATYVERVMVRVSWGASYGRVQSVQLSSLITNFDGSDTCTAPLSGIWNVPLVSSYLFGSITGIGDASGTYQLTNLDVHRGRLYVTVNTNANSLPASGPLSGTHAASDGRIGSVVWNTPSNSETSDNQYAIVNLDAGTRSQYLTVQDFGFSIPPGTTILGITVDVERKNSSTTNTTKDASVRLIRADGTLGKSDKTRSTTWPTSDAYSTYGASNDLWSESDWSPTAINSPAFGVAIAADAGGGSGLRTASIDHVRVTVTYTKQFYVLDVNHTPALIGGLDQNTIATGMNAVAVATSTDTGSHAYVALNSKTTQLQVLDVAVSSVRVVGMYSIAGANAVANTITYRDGYVYLGLEHSSEDEFIVIDVHDPTTPTLVGSYNVEAGINAIVLRDGRAYLATDDVNRELLVLDVHDLNHPVALASYNAPGASPGQGKSLALVGDTLHLGRYYSSNAPEAMRFDISSESPSVIDSHDVGVVGDTRGVYDLLVRDHLLFTLTGNEVSAGAKVQLFDLNRPNTDGPFASISLPNNGDPKALACEGNTLYALSVPRTGTYANRGSLSVLTPL